MLAIRVRYEFAGWHRWSDDDGYRAADKTDGQRIPPQHGFLGHVHRHLFKVTTTIRVEHENRAVEFFETQEAIGQIVGANVGGSGRWPGLWTARVGASVSCEQIAAGIAEELQSDDYDVLEVSVSEDGENDGVWFAESTS